MGQSKLNLSESVRAGERKRFNALKGFKKPIPAVYLAIGKSHIGRNKFKKIGLKRRAAIKPSFTISQKIPAGCVISDGEGNIYNSSEINSNE